MICDACSDGKTASTGALPFGMWIEPLASSSFSQMGGSSPWNTDSKSTRQVSEMTVKSCTPDAKRLLRSATCAPRKSW